MAIVLHKNKEIPWRWIAIITGNFEKHLFWHISLVPNNFFLPWWQRYFAYINLGIIHYLKNNNQFWIGLNFGKWHITLLRHY